MCVAVTYLVNQILQLALFGQRLVDSGVSVWTSLTVRDPFGVALCRALVWQGYAVPGSLGLELAAIKPALRVGKTSLKAGLSYIL